MVLEHFRNGELYGDTTHNMTSFAQSGRGATQGGVTPLIEADEVVRWKQTTNDSKQFELSVSSHNLKQKRLGLCNEPRSIGTCN
jgi:hypothetical protein